MIKGNGKKSFHDKNACAKRKEPKLIVCSNKEFQVKGKEIKSMKKEMFLNLIKYTTLFSLQFTHIYILMSTECWIDEKGNHYIQNLIKNLMRVCV